MEIAKKRVTYKELTAMGLIPWTCWRTTKRKIQTESFPAYSENGHWYFDPKEVEIWWKKRKQLSA